MTAIYVCNDCAQKFEFDENCILAIHPQDDCSPFARLIRICPECAMGYEPIWEQSGNDEVDDGLL